MYAYLSGFLVGCGSGRDLLGFQREGVAAVGVDLSRSLLREAVRAGVAAPLIVSDLRRVPLADCSVRGVWSMASLVHLARVEVVEAFTEFSRLRRSSSSVIFSVQSSANSMEGPSG